MQLTYLLQMRSDQWFIELYNCLFIFTSLNDSREWILTWLVLYLVIYSSWVDLRRLDVPTITRKRTLHDTRLMTAVPYRIIMSTDQTRFVGVTGRTCTYELYNYQPYSSSITVAEISVVEISRNMDDISDRSRSLAFVHFVISWMLRSIDWAGHPGAFSTSRNFTMGQTWGRSENKRFVFTLQVQSLALLH